MTLALANQTAAQSEIPSISETEHEQLDRYQKEIPPEAVQELQNARKFIDSGNFSGASPILQRLIDKYPTYYLAHYNHALVEGERGLSDDAIQGFVNAIEIKESRDKDKKLGNEINDYTAYTNLGWYYMQRYRYEDAKKFLLKSYENMEGMEIESKIRVLNNLGLLFYVRGHADQARTYLSLALNLGSPSAAELLALVAQLERMEKEVDIKSVVTLALEDTEKIARKIRWFETANKDEYLTYWSPTEEHASIGIGHFIWYPKNASNRFKETFPALLRFLEEEGVELPPWLKNANYNPWPNREAFQAAQQSSELRELRALMKRTVHEQVRFMILRLRNTLPTMLKEVALGKREKVKVQFQRVLRKPDGNISADGVYALLDYTHFKGEGIDQNERYKGIGWGLLQVLELMSGSEYGALNEFADAAEKVLKRRISNAPQEKQEAEQGYLAGWTKRLNSYRGG